MSDAPIVVIGAGMAGLAAAVTLVERGHEVAVYEASDVAGGRVRTDEVDGFLLDRGFQILLTAYPVAQRVFDYDALDLRRFQAGSLVQLDSGMVKLADPLRRHEDVLATVRAPVGTPIDKMRLLAWRHAVNEGTVDDVWSRPEVTASARLGDLKFSDQFISSFLQPLFAGISLDGDLSVTSRFIEFVFRMLGEGFGAVPARGMGELARQLADRLPDGSLHLETPVTSATADGVTLADGTRVEAAKVVVATDMDAAADLVGTPQLGWNGVTTWWFAADEPPFDEPLLFLNGTGRGVVNNVAVMSNVSPSYAPPGRHLIGISTPDGAAGDKLLDARADLRSWFGAVVDSWEVLRADEIPYAQPRHLPGEAVPAKTALDSGMFVAGDHRQNPSINGALQSGRAAARAVIAAL